MLFAEDAGFRRERLKKEILEFTLRQLELPRFQGQGSQSSSEEEEVFYTEGS